MSIANINYNAILKYPVDQDLFRHLRPPQQLIYPCANGMKLVVFKSGKCRIMGCKKRLKKHHYLSYNFSLPIKQWHLQSLSVNSNYGESINLHYLAQQLGSRNSTYEPEIFPGLRLLHFKPLCVNVFASGKIMILGVKTFKIKSLCQCINQYIFENL